MAYTFDPSKRFMRDTSQITTDLSEESVTTAMKVSETQVNFDEVFKEEKPKQGVPKLFGRTFPCCIQLSQESKTVGFVIEEEDESNDDMDDVDEELKSDFQIPATTLPLGSPQKEVKIMLEGEDEMEDVPETRAKYFLPNEVAIHDNPDDLYVSALGNVYNLTSLYKENKESPLVTILLMHGGQDLSHWFDKREEVITHMGPVANVVTPFYSFIHAPDELCQETVALPWWKDPNYMIGILTKKPRKIEVVNMLAKITDIVEVCSEETIYEIQKRYFKFNKRSFSYVWRHDGKDLDMNLTLEENGLIDHSEKLFFYRLNEDDFIPIINIFFKDDFYKDTSFKCKKSADIANRDEK